MTEPQRPRRPRQHALEDASRRGLEKRLPDEWVFRSQAADYGIDGEVEIFEDSLATGRLFKVQLKATDTDRLTVRLPVQKEAYFLSLNLPVLIVLYQAGPDRLFSRWFQSFDPYRGGRTATGITLRFSDSDEWSESSPERLRADVEAYFRLRDPRTAFPLQLSLHATSGEVAGVSADRVSVALRSIFARFRSLVQFAPPGEFGPMGSVELRPNEISVDLRGLASFTLHYGGMAKDHLSVAHDAGVALALLLDQLGLSAASAHLTDAFAPKSDVISEPEMALRAARAFSRAGRLRESLRLAERLAVREEEHVWMVAALLQLPAFPLDHRLSLEEKEELVTHYERMLTIAQRRDDNVTAAQGHHNLGNLMRWMNRWEEALQHYEQAGKLDPDYLTRAYYHGEVAGALFLKGQYSGAVEAYGRAIAMGANGELSGLYADALLMSGRYADAQAAFREHNASGNTRNPEWQLKEWALPLIRARAGDIQEPNVELGCMRAALSWGDPTDEDRRIRLAEALSFDGLCSQAWLNLGELEASRERFEEAFSYFLLAALLLRGDVRVWLQAVVSGLVHIGEPLFEDILACAYRLCGQEFLEAMGTITEQVPDAEGQRQLLDVLHRAVEEVDSRVSDVTVRFFGEGGEWVALRVPMSRTGNP